MTQISNQLLYQRLRNRVIEQIEFTTSLKDVAVLGAFEALNMVDNILPLDKKRAANVLNVQEQSVVDDYLDHAGRAAEATKDDIFGVGSLEAIPSWCAFSLFSKSALEVFMIRGRFSEDVEMES